MATALSVGVLVFLASSPIARAHAVDGAAVLDVPDWRYGLHVLRCIAEFVLGMLAYQFSVSPAGMKFASRAWIQDALAVTAIGLLMIPRTDFFMVCSIPPLLAGLARGTSFAARVLSSKPMELAGRYSYSIYLIHTLLYGVLGWIHHQVNAVGLKHGQTFAAFIGISLTLPLAALAYHMIEKPGRTFIRTLLEERPRIAVTPVPTTQLAPVNVGLESQE